MRKKNLWFVGEEKSHQDPVSSSEQAERDIACRQPQTDELGSQPKGGDEACTENCEAHPTPTQNDMQFREVDAADHEERNDNKEQWEDPIREEVMFECPVREHSKGDESAGRGGG